MNKNFAMSVTSIMFEILWVHLFSNDFYKC